MKDECVECTMSENTATLLDEPLVPVPFILKLCTVWQYFSASAFIFVSYKPGTWNCLLEIQVPRHWNSLQYISHYDWSN